MASCGRTGLGHTLRVSPSVCGAGRGDTGAGPSCKRPQPKAGVAAPAPALFSGPLVIFCLVLFVLAACLVTGHGCFFPPLPFGAWRPRPCRKEGVVDQKGQKKKAEVGNGRLVIPVGPLPCSWPQALTCKTEPAALPHTAGTNGTWFFHSPWRQRPLQCHSNRRLWLRLQKALDSSWWPSSAKVLLRGRPCQGRRQTGPPLPCRRC